MVSDAPLREYAEERINGSLGDLEWVGRAAVAHEAVVESFARADALLPMKLFTIFSTDERALADVARQGRRVDRLLGLVAGRQEWGVRVVFDPARAVAAATGGSGRQATTGIGYLRLKKSQRDAAHRLSRRARSVAADVFRTLSARSDRATRRSSSQAVEGGTLLLDAAFLVPRANAAKFKAALAGCARPLAPAGYVVSLTGPWPPYSFLGD